MDPEFKAALHSIAEEEGLPLIDDSSGFSGN